MPPRARAPSPGGAFDFALSQRPPEVRRLATALRDLIRAAAPGATQCWIAGWQALAFRETTEFCFIRPLKAGVRLGFYQGDRLADPARLLRGFAKRIRFVGIRTVEDLDVGSIEGLIASARVVSAAEACREVRNVPNES